jgi:mannitol-1-phosphate/altronate dehydrogenase
MAAENHNHAAEILESALLDETPEAESASVRTRVRFLNTLIGKMSGMVTDAREAVAQWLATITPQDPRAFLVEAFNRILISRICFDEASGGHRLPRGLTVFKEKGDLLPFEEAKLYGHNWTHALGAYIGTLRGLQQIADLRDFPDILRFLRAGLSRNRGEALIRKHSG